MELPITLEVWGGKYPLSVVVDDYACGGTAVKLEPRFCVVSVWLDSSPSLPPGTFYVKHWGQEEIIEALLKKGIICLAPGIPPARSGFVENIRAYQFTREAALQFV